MTAQATMPANMRMAPATPVISHSSLPAKGHNQRTRATGTRRKKQSTPKTAQPGTARISAPPPPGCRRRRASPPGACAASDSIVASSMCRGRAGARGMPRREQIRAPRDQENAGPTVESGNSWIVGGNCSWRRSASNQNVNLAPSWMRRALLVKPVNAPNSFGFNSALVV